MRRPIFLIFTNAMILIVICCLLVQSLIIVPRLAMTDKAVGSVEVQRGGRGGWQGLGVGTAVKTGDVVRTGSDGSAEFVWVGGTRMKLMPNSQMTIARALYNSVHQGENSELKLSTGKVFVRIMKSLNPASSFQVETPTAVAAVRGTIFSVEASGGKTQVAVWKGHVDVSAADAEGREAGSAVTILPGRCAVAPGDGAVQTKDASAQNAAFARETSIVQPHLTLDAEPSNAGHVLLRGETESGDTATLNGAPLRVLGNGVFRKNVALHPGVNTFTVVSTDKHGATSTLAKTVQGG